MDKNGSSRRPHQVPTCPSMNLFFSLSCPTIYGTLASLFQTSSALILSLSPFTFSDSSSSSSSIDPSQSRPPPFERHTRVSPQQHRCSYEALHTWDTQRRGLRLCMSHGLVTTAFYFDAGIRALERTGNGNCGGGDDDDVFDRKNAILEPRTRRYKGACC